MPRVRRLPFHPNIWTEWLGYSPCEFGLRMTREEIGSFLGLKLETVSRLFSRFQQEGLIQAQGRAVKLLDVTALKQLAGQRA